MSGGIKNRIFGLDIIRCTAILFVLFSHTSYLLPLSSGSQYYFHVFFGFLGVEFFFVLSGYLVGKILLELVDKQSISFNAIKYFWIRRWFRTLPVYYLSLMLYSILFYFSNDGFLLSQNSYLLYFFFSQNFISPHPDFFILAWSISIEEWFYLLMPITFLIAGFFAKLRARTLLSIIIVLITGITLCRVFVVCYYDSEWDAGIRRIVPLRLDALLTGVLAAYSKIYFEKSWTKYSKYWLVFGLIILLLSAFWLFRKVIVTYMVTDFFSKTFLFNFFSFGIALCLPYLSEIKTVKNRFIGKLITHISIVSYSLYLLHVLISYMVITILNKLFMQDIALLKFASVWVFSILSATVLYKWYERPFMNLRERFKL